MGVATGNGQRTWMVRDRQSLDPFERIHHRCQFCGAALLTVGETWFNADGSTGFATITNNVEAYAPGSPIFA